jgi:pimeloyl-ACP methyl ester carboxylesterase
MRSALIAAVILGAVTIIVAICCTSERGDAYARPGAFEASIAWYRARNRDRAVLESAPPNSLVVDQPTTIFWTDRDPVAPRDWADGIGAYFTHMSLQKVSDVGHFLVWERPLAFVDATVDLLRRC